MRYVQDMMTAQIWGPFPDSVQAEAWITTHGNPFCSVLVAGIEETFTTNTVITEPQEDT